MNVACLVLLVGMAPAANERVLDAFDYPNSQAAREAWVAGHDTRPVEMVGSGDDSALEFQALFASEPEVERTIVDREVDLDLSAPGQFTLDMAAERPEVAGRVSLYFQSGGGWYSAVSGLSKAGWQTLRFSKASFQIEDEPAGWDQIDRIRISVWRSHLADSRIRVRKLAASWHDVALVIPKASADREVSGAREAANDLAGMLAELGLGSDAVDDEAILDGALGDRHIALLAYHPRLGEEAVDALERFVEQGGKLFACYSLPGRLARVLGAGNMQYVRPEERGFLAEIRFDDATIVGLPESVRQASWNIHVPEPVGAGARIIGHWYDAEGNPTGHAAMLVSDSGAYFSHLVLPDDRPGKKQLLAAVLGHLHPPLWEQMARSELEAIGSVGHLDTAAALAEYVRTRQVPLAVVSLDAGQKAQALARRSFDRGDYPEVVGLARKARRLLVEAYVASVPSRANEGRAFWNHSGMGAYPGDWERTAQELAAAGFNMVVPNLLWGGRAHYPSEVLPRSETFREHGDQIAQCVAACKKHGLEVHVWKVNFNLSRAPKEFVDKLRSEARLQVSHSGKEQSWLCPSHPANFALELESMLEVARKYDVEGLHFDYIRYPNRDHCYCDGCRTRFEEASGKRVAQWPADCYSGDLKAAYHDFRCEQITRLVAAVSREAKKIKPAIDISAAVFNTYPDCRESVGQDWAAWVEAGYLDFLCPMDYTQSDLHFKTLVENQLRLVGGRIPVYPGIGAWRLEPDRVVGQIHVARSLGAAGFTIFDLGEEAARSVVPVVASGAGSARATPPHRSSD